jgi:hypothetical protein
VPQLRPRGAGTSWQTCQQMDGRVPYFALRPFLLLPSPESEWQQQER